MNLEIGNQIILKPRAMGSAGEGIASLDGFVVFVDGALPGEEVLAEITKVSKNFAKAKMLELRTPSPDRIKPPCPVFGKCGGCQLQHMNYQAQLQVKKQRVVDALERIGRLDQVVVADCVPSEKQFAYRNKIQLPVIYTPEGLQLGLYAHETHNVIPIEHCLIHCEMGEQVFQHIKRLKPPTQGKIRYLLIKTAVKRKEVLVVLVTTGLDKEWLKRFSDGISVRGVVENINTREDNVVLGSHFNLISGESFIEEEICGKVFQISPHSFFQVNTEQAELLYKKVFELAELDQTKVLVDAFCGVGSFSLIASDHVKKVYGIECVSLAIDDARENAKRNGVTNAKFIHGRAEEQVAKLGPVDVVFLNPPRKGCESRFLEGLRAPIVIYMSCNPATLARDLLLLSPHYTVETVIPFDMFPQTTHVETVVKLRRHTV